MNTSVRNILTAATLALGLGLCMGVTPPAHAQSQICEKQPKAGYSIGTEGWVAELAGDLMRENPQFLDNAYRIRGSVFTSTLDFRGNYFGNLKMTWKPDFWNGVRPRAIVHVTVYGPHLPYGGISMELDIVRITTDDGEHDYVWAKACQT